MKRQLAMLLVVTLLIGMMPIMQGQLTTHYAETNDPNVYEGHRFYTPKSLNSAQNAQDWMAFKQLRGIPIELPYENKDGFRFNLEIWYDKHIVVYGSYEDVSNNDFKNARADGFTGEIPNEGYYRKGHLKGEYRYHGYTTEGSKYGNNDFPVDQVLTESVESLNYLYRIWEDTHPHYRRPWNQVERIKEVSDYNFTAIEANLNPTLQNETRQWIAETLPFQIKRGEKADLEAYNYAHVQSRPTTLFGGEAMLWHMRSEPWYFTVSLDKRKGKLHTPLELIITDVSDNDVYMKDDVKNTVVVKATVKATLKDEHMYDGIDEHGIKDDVLRGAYYNREDIDYWTLTLKDRITNETHSVRANRTGGNTAQADFEFSLEPHQYEHLLGDDDKLNIAFDATATVFYHDGEKATRSAADEAQLGATRTVVREVREPFEPSKPLIIDIEAVTEMLDTERFSIRDHTDLSDGYEREVILDGRVLSKAEEETFLSGNHVFPLIGKDSFYHYTISYTLDGKEYLYQSFVMVYSTKPYARAIVTGTLKENRLLTATASYHSTNTPYLLANSTIVPIAFTVSNLEGSHDVIKYGTNTATEKQFIVKDETTIEVTYQVRAQISPSKLQRNDIPIGYHDSNVYSYKAFVVQDYAPALYANIWTTEMARGERINYTYDASSVDGDTISLNTYKIYHDSKGDESFSTLVKQGNYQEGIGIDYVPDKLGYYKIVFEAEETFAEATLPQHITSADKRRTTLERVFHVDNLAPMTKLYTNIEYNFPEADLIVLTDQSITRTLNNDILSERMNWINALRQSGIVASVQNWDLHTYVYTQSVATSTNTGSSYPSSTIPYTSDGYSGTLSRTNVYNSPYTHDFGGYVTSTTSQTFVSYHTNVVTTYKTYDPYTQSTDHSSPAPSSISINENGFVGSIGISGTSTSGPYTDSTYDKDGKLVSEVVTQYWEVTYSGTLSKSTTVWQSDIRWVDDYSATYSGTIYKHVKQSFTPSFKTKADKYLVYFADQHVNNKTDIQAIQNRGDTKLILVGKASTKPALSHDYYIDSSKPLQDIIAEINRIVVSNNPVENKQLLLVDQAFEMKTANYDDEKDPIKTHGFLYIHNPNYYDNPMGQEQGTVSAFTESVSAYKPTLKTAFSKSGHYEIYRLIEDEPIGFPNYNKLSNRAKIDIYVHRKPIADFTLDWDYNALTNMYITKWVDLSYDLDHQYSDAQRGIRERQIRYRRTTGNTEWIYAIPNNLTHGTYEVSYMVKDIEGAWSDEVVKTYTLESVPPIQLWASLRTTDPTFSLRGIPASEYLTVYDMASRYYKPHHITVHGHQEQAASFLNHEMSNYDLLSNTWFHRRVLWRIPPTTPDGTYAVTVTAKSVTSPFVETKVQMSFAVNTPIDVHGSVPLMVEDEPAVLEAHAGKYAQKVWVKAFVGTAYESIYPMSRESMDSPWQVQLMAPEAGHYQCVFYAQTASGKLAEHMVSTEVEAFRILSVQIKGYWAHWGQSEPLRFLSHEKVRIEVNLIGKADAVSITFSPELMAMVYRDDKGHIYRHRDTFGEDLVFPFSLAPKSENTWEGELILPYASSTVTWENVRQSRGYWLEASAKKGNVLRTHRLEGIDITGNVYDALYYQPSFGQ